MTAAHAGRRALAARGTDGQAGVDTVNQVVVRATKRVRIVMDKVEPT